MQHRFCVELAQQYDIITAVFLDHFCFWLSKNETEDINFRDGTHWIRCSTKYLTKYFPYLTERQIDYQLRKMVENNLLIKGDYKDSVSWFTFTNFVKEVLQNCRMYNLVDSNIVSVEDKLNNIAKVKRKEITRKESPDMNQLKSEFDSIWKMYPRKVSKSVAFRSYIKARMENVDFEAIKSGVERYANYCKLNKIESSFIAHGSTWFNQHRWEDEYSVEFNQKDKKDKIDENKDKINMGVVL